MRSVLQIEGMTCQNCVRHVRETLEGVEGVIAAEVDLESAKARVRWGETAANDARLVEAVAAAGYGASIGAATNSPAPSDHHSGHGWWFNVVFGSLVTFPLMFGEWIFGLGHRPWFGWLSFALVLPVQFVCGWRFYRGAWRQLKIGQSNMDTLVALGSSVAFFYSVYGLFAPGHVAHLYFVEAAAIITLISIGHYLEARTSERAAGAVRALLQLAPQTARRIGADGRTQTVPVNELVREDRVAVAPGDCVPLDGVVEEGRSAVDESMLTGESRAVEKSPGARLYAGTTNHEGHLVMRVQATGEETALAKIVSIVQRAQTSRAQIQRLGDRVSSVFVPCVIVVAAATVLGWGILAHGGWETGLVNAVAVLIVACPCAMGLATPAAIMAGANAAAKRGILIRDGTALEKSGRVTAVVFDKTGTLTQGRPRVESEQVFTGEEEEFRRIASALVRPSRHPLSLAIAAEYDTITPASVTDWREQSGAGVRADYGGDTIRLGSLRWLEQEGVDVTRAGRLTEGTVIGVARGPTMLGALGLADSLKPNAAAVVARLKASGLEVYLLSGDRRSAVENVGKEVGIPGSNVFAEIQPEGKAGEIEKLQAKSLHVAFVGDGINDAPALAQADLGIAVMQASDVAREAADILLLKSDLEAIPEALSLSVATLRTIKQNLFWAFFYNAAAIPLAAFGWISPIICAGAMALSDLFVIGNALRLYRWKLPPASGRPSSSRRSHKTD